MAIGSIRIGPHVIGATAVLPERMALEPITEGEFNELIRMIRMDRHAKLTQCIVNRPGAERVTVYLVNGDPIAAVQAQKDSPLLLHFKRIV